MGRRFIGVIVPATNSSIEHEFHKAVPPGIFVNTERLWNVDFPRPKGETNPEYLKARNKDLERAVTYVAQAKGPREGSTTELIVYGCTAASFMEGPRTDTDISERIEKATGIPAITATTCVTEALLHLGIKKLSVASPYGTRVNILLDAFFANSGFEVLNVDTPGESSFNSPLVGDDPSAFVDAVASIVSEEADGVFVSSTGVCALEMLDDAEKRIGKPVITSNQAAIWTSLRRLGVTTPINRFGSLLRTLDK